ncbi:hypothetical protein ACHAXT_003204 [Thalassiosira profunda]
MGRRQQRSRKGRGKGKGVVQESRPTLRFKVGDRVKCWYCDDADDDLEELFELSMEELMMKMVLTDNQRSLKPGTVVQHWWKDHSGIEHPYQVRLDNGMLIYARTDTDQCIEKGDTPAPQALLPVEAVNDPILFQQPPQREDCPICFVHFVRKNPATMGKKSRRIKGKGNCKSNGGVEERRPELRFKKGDRVMCCMGPRWPDDDEMCKLGAELGLEAMRRQIQIIKAQPRQWAHGTVVKLWWAEPGTTTVHPYQIRVDEGELVYALTDTDTIVRRI